MLQGLGCSRLFTFACAALAATTMLAADKQTVTIVTPGMGEPAYRIAGAEFSRLWEQVTGARPQTAVCGGPDFELPSGDVVLMGSDAVNPAVHRLVLQARIQSLGIRYGADDYRILALPDAGRTVLIVAGGSGRSTLYATYDFFRRQAGAEYYWDGDVIPKRTHIALAGCDFTEQPHFAYRGLRYFAHRGPHRFQAEMWDLDDWKREIDWMLKKRFNLFMLRTGIDDLFQRAFPELPYPPTDGVDPDAEPRSYNDRTSFWPLKYRGELRKRVLAYARERGLLHPEDTGTITHWYSHTPSSFYQKYPDFPVTRDQKTGYKLATAAIWDVERERTWDAYWKLTETHIREFGQPRMFHTIGLAERRFGADERENLLRKLHAYHKIQEVLRRRYPDAPLLIASWDMMGWWKDGDVQNLLKEFDPTRTIMLDYTADLLNRKTYRDWDMVGKFPWIFGVFHAFAADSDIRGDYAVLQERIGEAAQDKQCQGLVLWPEISHSNTLLLEYLAANGWKPDQLDAQALLGRFCAHRYPAALAAGMKPAWTATLPIAATHHWTHRTADHPAIGLAVQFDPHCRMLASAEYASLNAERVGLYAGEFQRLAPSLREAPTILKGLAELAPAGYENALWRRDAIDIVRTIVNRAIKASLLRGSMAMEAWRTGHGDEAAVRSMEKVSKGLMQRLGDLLELSDDYSLFATVQRLGRAGELGGVAPKLNPHTEATLKGNSENGYCRAHQYELVRYVYQAEIDEHWKWVESRLQSKEKKPWTRPASFTAARKAIQDRFYDTPLAQMAPTRPRSATALKQTIEATAKFFTPLLEPKP